MSKPTLSQMIEIVKEHQTVVNVVSGTKTEYIACRKAVEEYGDVEVKDVRVTILPKWEQKEASNEFKAMFSLFI